MKIDELTRSYGKRYEVLIFGDTSIFTEDQQEKIRTVARSFLRKVLFKPEREDYAKEWVQTFLEETAYHFISYSLHRNYVDDLSTDTWDSIRKMAETQFSKRLEVMARLKREEQERLRQEKERREANKLKVGDWFEIEVNQGKREATVLAVLGDEALIEYAMPNTTTALWVVDIYDYGHLRNMSYQQIIEVKRNHVWLREMYETGVEWERIPQGSVYKRYGEWFRRGDHPGSVKDEYERLSRGN